MGLFRMTYPHARGWFDLARRSLPARTDADIYAEREEARLCEVARKRNRSILVHGAARTGRLEYAEIRITLKELCGAGGVKDMRCRRDEGAHQVSAPFLYVPLSLTARAKRHECRGVSQLKVASARTAVHAFNESRRLVGVLFESKWSPAISSPGPGESARQGFVADRIDAGRGNEWYRQDGKDTLDRMKWTRWTIDEDTSSILGKKEEDEAGMGMGIGRNRNPGG